MKILTLTTLFPNDVDKQHGIFIETRLRKFADKFDPEIKVIAPVPWFPIDSKLFGQYAKFARVSRRETRFNLEVDHPRYPVVPKVGMNIAPVLLALSCIAPMRKLKSQGYDFDLIDAHYFYPDGVAAALLSTWFKKPVVVSARGSDINYLSKYRIPGYWIKYVKKHINHSITVSGALKDEMIELGYDPSKISVIRNGVDLELFTPPVNRQALREELGLTGNVILSVGRLVKLKGHDLVIRAMSEIPDTTLLIAGEGPEKESLNDLIRANGLQSRIKLLGSVNQHQLVKYYGAADLLVLASENEGWANVLLEAMACGTPVVAANTGGTPEVVSSADAGLLVNRDVESLREGFEKLLAIQPDRSLVRRYAEGYSWDTVAENLMDVYNGITTGPLRY